MFVLAPNAGGRAYQKAAEIFRQFQEMPLSAMQTKHSDLRQVTNRLLNMF